MKQFTYTITDPLGLHARPAGLLVKTAKRFPDTALSITKDGTTVKATQLLKLMALGVQQGSQVTVTADGTSEEEAIEAMREFFAEHL
jgi:phosphocarrier protein